MSQYAKELPVDKNNNPYTVSIPNFPAAQSWGSVFVASSTIGLSDRTTVVQIAAVGAPALVKWGSGTVSSSTFDAVVPGNTQITFVVPQSVFASNASAMGANGANGLYNKITVLSVGTTQGSVFGSEF